MSHKAEILVVDDSATQAMGMRLMLEASGHSVRIAENGLVALNEVRRQQPDIVVTDLLMPEMDGLELVDALRAEFPKVPIILTTGKGSEEIACQALERGASSYVPKRHLQDELLETVDRILTVSAAANKHTNFPALLSSIDLELEIDNDEAQISSVIERLERPLNELGLLTDRSQMQIATAMDEALRNAIVHGNLEISSELRHAEDGKHYQAAVKEKLAMAPYCDRKVHIRLVADQTQATLSVRDDGPGFDIENLPDPTDPCNLDKCGGRGLLLINAFMDEVRHNEAGNEIIMIKRRPAEPS